MTCERRVFDQGARLLSWRSANGFLPPMMEEEVQVEEPEEIGETHGKEQGEEQTVKEQTTLKHMTWMTM